MKLRPLLFVLPNLFTVSSIFCGFYVLTLCGAGATPADLYQAALVTLFSNFFDTFDGRVARLTRTQSRFGMELDSLADVVAFGVAPAALLYRWALAPLGLGGLLVAFAFVACGALRLARFNVIAHASEDGGKSPFFVGLPIPLASISVASLVIAHFHASGGGLLAEEARGPLVAVALILSALMVSTVRYRTFKDVRPSPRAALALLAVLAASVLIAIKLHPAYILLALSAAYLSLGLGESLVWLSGWLTGRIQSPEAALAAGEDEDEVAAPEEGGLL